MQAVNGRRSRQSARGFLLTEAGLLVLLTIPLLVILAGVTAVRTLSGAVRLIDPDATAGEPYDMVKVATTAPSVDLKDRFLSSVENAFTTPSTASRPLWLHLPPDFLAWVDHNTPENLPDGTLLSPDASTDDIIATAKSGQQPGTDAQSVAVGSLPTEFASVNVGAASIVTPTRSIVTPRPIKLPARVRLVLDRAPPVRRAAAPPAAPPAIELPMVLRPSLTPASE